jgi:hypothetical protein
MNQPPLLTFNYDRDTLANEVICFSFLPKGNNRRHKQIPGK